MRRELTDPRCVEILAALDRAMRSPERDEAVVALVLCNLLALPSDPHLFMSWPNENARAYLCAYLELCPDEHLDETVTAARDALAWLATFEAEQAAERDS